MVACCCGATWPVTLAHHLFLLETAVYVCVLQTEKFYDMLGTGSFAALAVGSLLAGTSRHARQVRYPGSTGCEKSCCSFGRGRYAVLADTTSSGTAGINNITDVKIARTNLFSGPPAAVISFWAEVP